LQWTEKYFEPSDKPCKGYEGRHYTKNFDEYVGATWAESRFRKGHFAGKITNFFRENSYRDSRRNQKPSKHSERKRTVKSRVIVEKTKILSKE